MVTISKALALVLSSAITLSAASAGARASEYGPVIFKAGHGVSLDVGPKRVVGYYMAKDRICDVTLMIAERPDADGHVAAGVTRVNIPVKAGANARVYTSEGRTVALSCSTSTNLMTLRTIDLTASAAKF